MNITSLEIAQATMDMFFCLFCLIMFVSIKATKLHFNDAVFIYSNNCNSCTVLYLWIFYNQFRTGNRFIRNICCIYV